jgi:amylovoran biosynthesis glycosyltransferase AmsB
MINMSNIGLFTVVIPNYNRVYELVRAVKSVLKQQEYVDEIIVVDDCSDNIEDISYALGQLKSDKISLIKNKFKSNAAQTRNQGAKLASSEWVLLLDSDDVFLEGKLSAIKSQIESDNSSKIVYYNKAQVWFDSKLERIAPSRALAKEENISDYLFIDSEIMQTSTLAVHQAFFSECGFNEKYKRHQDYDLCLSLYHAGYEFKLVDIQGTAIYWGSSNRPTDKGESAEYSRQWALENRQRMSYKAFDNFYFYFVVLKLLRAGKKIESIKRLRDIGSFSSVSIKRKLIFAVLFLMPSYFMNTAYLAYKKMITHLSDKNPGKI